MAQEKEYFAFISYKREDEKWAKWLQHKLEHYRLPVNVRKENPSLPQTIRPVFKDTSELAAGVLADEIQDALENSNHLIVVCSPLAAQSKWVGNEVKTFIDMGRTDKIIPFIIGGTPFSDNPEDECFPSVLLNLPKEQELLGVNINEMGRDAAVVKVVSRMFDVKFDTLWQRHEKERRKRRSWIIAFVATAFLCISTIAYWMYVQNNKMLENRNRFIAEKALSLAKNGHSQTAYMLLLEALDSGPYVEELEYALRSLISCENMTIDEHTANVNSAFYGNDGKSIVSASNDSTIRVWDANTGIEVKRFKGHFGKVRFASFNKEALFIASASDDKSIRIWDINNNCLIKVLEGHGDWTNSANFSPDGKHVVSTSHDNTARIWSVDNWSCVDTLQGHTSAVWYAEYSPDGKLIVTASWDKTVKVWDAVTGNCIHTLQGHTDDIHCARFSPNGKYIVSSSFDKSIRVWDVSNGECLAILEGHSNPVLFASFSPDGKLIASVSGQFLGAETTYSSSSDKNEIKVWDWSSNKCIGDYSGHQGRINTIVFHPKNNILLTASDDNTIRTWGNKLDMCKTADIGKVKPKNISISPQGDLLAFACWDSNVALWDTKKEKTIKILNNDSCEAHATAFSSDGNKIAVASSGGSIKVWELSNFHCKTLVGHNGITHSVDFDNSGKFVVSTAIFDNSVRVWNVKTNQCKLLNGHSDYAQCAVYSPDGKFIASGGKDKTIIIWDAVSCNLLFTLRGHSGRVTALKFTPDGSHLVSASSDRSIRIWNIETQQCERIFYKDNKMIYSIDISRDGKCVLSGSRDKTVCIWDLQTGACLNIFRGHNAEVRSVRFSPIDNKIYSLSQDYELRIWDNPFFPFLSFNELVDQIRLRIGSRKLTPEESRQYYLE